MTQVNVSQAAQLLKEAQDILIICHRKPDGDTLGSAFALYEALEQLGKRADVVCSDPFPNRFSFLSGQYTPKNFSAQFVVAVDVADTTLLGDNLQPYAQKINLCIDHHPSNTAYAQYLLLDAAAAATAQLIAKLIEALGVTFTPSMAAAVFTGITTDTGCFRYSNVTSETHRIAAQMIDLGADHAKINRLMFETHSVARIAVEKLVMDTLEYYFEKKVAMILISNDMIKKTHANEDDLEGISSIPRTIEGVEVGVTFREEAENTYKISMRTHENINASEICGALGGGGHARAAGCTVYGSYAQAKQMVLAQLQKKLKKA